MRNWNIEDIKSSELPDTIKQILLHEYYNITLTDTDPNNYSGRSLTYKQFKEEYNLYLNYLVKLLGNNYFLTSDLYRIYDYTMIARYDFEETDLTDEDLIEHVLDFYESLEDKEILEIINRILDEKNGHLRIQPYDKENPICKEVKGRCIKPKEDGLLYASFYMQGTSEDLTILTHETGHMLSHALFGSKINPIVYGFLSETESYLFELLMNTYIAKSLELPNLAIHLEANRTAKIIDTIWNIRIEQILYRQFGKNPNMKRLNRILKRDGLITNYTDEDFKDLTTFTLYELHHLLHSYLVALHFYNEITLDKEKGIYEYKKFMLSPARSTKTLFTESKIDYEDLISKMDHMYTKAVTLKKRNTSI